MPSKKKKSQWAFGNFIYSTKKNEISQNILRYDLIKRSSTINKQLLPKSRGCAISNQKISQYAEMNQPD